MGKWYPPLIDICDFSCFRPPIFMIFFACNIDLGSISTDIGQLIGAGVTTNSETATNCVALYIILEVSTK